MNNKYVDPFFLDVLSSVPARIKNEVDYSFGIAARIDALLKQKGWSKSELAKRTGKKCSEVTKWLSGTQNFTLRTIALIEEALGCKLISITEATFVSPPITITTSSFAVFPTINEPRHIKTKAHYGRTKRSKNIYTQS